jgi:CRISPR-associated Csx2 family protein
LNEKEKEAKVYEKVSYRFDDGTVYQTAVFTEALIRSKRCSPDRVLLIGTHTSSWATLLDADLEGEGKHIELYGELESMRETGVTPELLRRLEGALVETWGIPCTCISHTADISEKEAFGIINQYFSAIAAFRPSKLVFDITHGFRSIPVMMSSSIQFIEALQAPELEIEVVYGEFIKKGEDAPVRFLKPVWEATRITRAVRTFEEKFDGEPLRQFLGPIWPTGADGIVGLGDCIQSNYVLQLDKHLEALRVSFASFPKDAPPWAVALCESLKRFHRELAKCGTLHERVAVLASMLADRRLYGQAIIMLQLAFEVYAYSFDPNVKIFKSQEATIQLVEECIRAARIPNKQLLWKLRDTRNSIAHGGLPQCLDAPPLSRTLPKQFQEYREIVGVLFAQRA